MLGNNRPLAKFNATKHAWDFLKILYQQSNYALQCQLKRVFKLSCLYDRYVELDSVDGALRYSSYALIYHLPGAEPIALFRGAP